MACMHCGQPACAEACTTEAISKRAEDGVVMVDKDKCNGCRDCLTACPYDVPQFDSNGIMQKCDYCIGIGEEPVCAAACPAEALHCVVIDDASKPDTEKPTVKYSGKTEPSVIITKTN